MVNGNLLKTVRFLETTRWNVNSLFATTITSSYLTEPIGKHTEHITTKTKLFLEPEKEHGILGISNEKGMFDAYLEYGKNINQAYIYVEDGFIAYNPYRINVGSIGIKTASLKNEYISPAYVVLKCKDTILPEYLFLVLKSNFFNLIIKEKTTGSVRQTLSYENLATIRIPIPSIDEQRTILSCFYKEKERAQKIRNEAECLENSINKTICDLLGITMPEPASDHKRGLCLLNYSECDRWSVEYLINKDSCSFIETTKYPIVYAKQFIRDCQYGLSEKATEEKTDYPVLRMNNLQKTVIDISELKYLPNNTKGIGRYVLNEGDLLFNRTNSKELVGKTAVFSLKDKYVFASYLIRVVINTSVADVRYINYLFASIIIRSQIDLLSRQVLGQANINVEELKALRFPLPPLEEQKRIAETIDAIFQSSTTKQKEADDIEEKAFQRFEANICG